ncbi:MAG TPA: hypothetical protein VL221_14885 [Bacteroidota bacterium]|nr:hypothetical protein [Bacteroidota bacterium]
MRSLILFLLLLFGACIAVAQDATPPDPAGDRGSTFLPPGTIFAPLRANYEEPRVGIRKEAGTSRLKLDIGSSIDFVEFRPDTCGGRFRIGADFFTYALTTSSEGLRLQVDAVDGFFGGHVAYATGDGHLLARLRLLHISGHLIDGHWNHITQQWIDNKLPIPYTRDFGELVGEYAWHGEAATLCAYSGFSYATLVRPDSLARFATIHGVELHTTGLTGPVGGRPFSVYIADNLAFTGIPTYYGTNTLESGVKFGDWDGRGVRFYLSYYHGLEVFSQYYYVKTDQWGLGFAFDAW